MRVRAFESALWEKTGKRTVCLSEVRTRRHLCDDGLDDGAGQLGRRGKNTILSTLDCWVCTPSPKSMQDFCERAAVNVLPSVPPAHSDFG